MVVLGTGRGQELLARARSRAVTQGSIPPADSQLVGGAPLGSVDRAQLEAQVRAALVGAGPLQPLLDAPGTTDVLVNGPEEVWVDRGGGLERAEVDLGGPAEVRALAVRLAALAGRRLDDARPTVDATLPDGTRLHAVLPPLSPAGTVLSLRVLRPVVATLADLRRRGTVDATVGATLAALVARRANVLVCGGTGAGKTTLLSVVLGAVPHDERIVCVEDVPELAPVHPHVVRLVVREPNVEGAGGVDAAELVRQALRMRPDRLVVGECRGAEVREVLTALNTGHAGGWATLHANGVTEVPARLAALGALAGMSPSTVGLQVRGAVDAVVHVVRQGGRRRVGAVGVVVPADGELRVGVEPVLVRDADGVTDLLPGWRDFSLRWLDGSRGSGHG